jgi:CRISPR-associated exonuclease Cas4
MFIVVAPVIVYAISALIIISLILFLASRNEAALAKKARVEYGIPRGQVIYTDLDRPAKPLFSRKFKIAGKPDYIIRDEQLKSFIPVEVKSGNAKRPHWGHVLQLAAYCLLVEEAYATQVPYGLIVYADGKQHRIDFDDALRSEVLLAANKMRRCLEQGIVNEGKRLKGRCHSCSVRGDCQYAKER